MFSLASPSMLRNMALRSITHLLATRKTAPSFDLARVKSAKTSYLTQLSLQHNLVACLIGKRQRNDIHLIHRAALGQHVLVVKGSVNIQCFEEHYQLGSETEKRFLTNKFVRVAPQQWEYSQSVYLQPGVMFHNNHLYSLTGSQIHQFMPSNKADFILTLHLLHSENQRAHPPSIYTQATTMFPTPCPTSFNESEFLAQLHQLYWMIKL